jgi:hypothetical protein
MDYLTTSAAALLGVAAPLLISLLKNSQWPVWVKMSLAVGVSLMFAAIAVFATQGQPVSVEEYIQLASVVFTVATVFYQTYFSKTDFNTTLTEMLYVKTPEVAPLITPVVEAEPKKEV